MVSCSTNQISNSAQRQIPQPDGLPEISRGLRSAATTPPVRHETGTTLKESQIRTKFAHDVLHPFRVRDFAGRLPGVSLRSTPGYLLASLRDARMPRNNDGEWIYESLFAALKNKAVAAAA